MAFRALALRTFSHNLGLLYHLQPTDAGTRPLQRISSSSAQLVLRTQAFLTEEQWHRHRYYADIPSPPTYSAHTSEVPYLYANNLTHAPDDAPRP